MISLNDAGATVGKTVEIDKVSKDKIASFLSTKGYENFVITSGKKSSVGNGFFYAIEGKDGKSKKEYYIELVCTPDYTDWAILFTQDKSKPKK